MSYLLAIVLIIIVHEAGHLFAAAVVGIKIEQVCLFLNPFFSIGKRKVLGTEVILGWLPLGGYVKISEIEVEKLELIFFYSMGIIFNVAVGITILGGTLPELIKMYFTNTLEFCSFKELFGFTSLVVAAINLIPFEGTDGQKIYKLIKK